MNKIELIRKYFDVFYNSKDFDSLSEILHDDLEFKGPLFESDSKAEYIRSLIESPPVNVNYEIIDEFYNEEAISILYQFIKDKQSTLMSQSFWFTGKQINKIYLIFNSSDI